MYIYIYIYIYIYTDKTVDMGRWALDLKVGRGISNEPKHYQKLYNIEKTGFNNLYMVKQTCFSLL